MYKTALNFTKNSLIVGLTSIIIGCGSNNSINDVNTSTATASNETIETKVEVTKKEYNEFFGSLPTTFIVDYQNVMPCNVYGFKVPMQSLDTVLQIAGYKNSNLLQSYKGNMQKFTLIDKSNERKEELYFLIKDLDTNNDFSLSEIEILQGLKETFGTKTITKNKNEI